MQGSDAETMVEDLQEVLHEILALIPIRVLADLESNPCAGGSCDGEDNGPESEDNYASVCMLHQIARTGEVSL